MKARVSNFGLLHSPLLMGALAELEPFDVITDGIGPCSCRHDKLGQMDPRGDHAASCLSQYVEVKTSAGNVIVYRPNIEVIAEEEVTA